MPIYYHILNADHTTKKVARFEYLQWEKSVSQGYKTVALDKIEKTNCRVSTVFLGINHSWNDDDDPILFETLIFDGDKDGEMWRYSTWDEAVQGHLKAVELCGGKKEKKKERKIDDSIKSRFDILDL